MIRRVHCLNCQGKKSDRCRDTYYFRENGEFGFYSLADGLNSSPKSHLGARAVQKALADEWEKDPEAFFEMPTEQIKDKWIEIIHQVLYNLAGKDETADDYASTLLIVCIFPRLRLYKWAHIGDGIIMKENCWGQREMVSFEQNGITRQFTFTTANARLSRYLRMGEGNMNLVRRFLLFTDGAILPFYRNRQLTEKGEEILEGGVDAVNRILEQFRLADDYTMLDIWV